MSRLCTVEETDMQIRREIRNGFAHRRASAAAAEKNRNYAVSCRAICAEEIDGFEIAVYGLTDEER